MPTAARAAASTPGDTHPTHDYGGGAFLGAQYDPDRYDRNVDRSPDRCDRSIDDRLIDSSIERTRSIRRSIDRSNDLWIHQLIDQSID